MKATSDPLIDLLRKKFPAEDPVFHSRHGLSMYFGPHGQFLRRVALWSFWFVLAIVTFGALMAGKAYLEVEPGEFEHSLRMRRYSGVYDRTGLFLGAIGRRTTASSAAKANDQEEARTWAFVPASRDLPPVYKSAVLAMEDRHLLNQGVFHICGTHVPSMLFRAVSSGLAFGGSGLVLQATKMVREPDIEKPDGAVDRLLAKFRQFGEGCALWRQIQAQTRLTASTGALRSPVAAEERVLSLYADVTPLVQGGGGNMRGIEAASNVIWGQAELTSARQLVLAAAHKAPIILGRDPQSHVPCAVVVRSQGAGRAAQFDPASANLYPVRTNHCRLIARARKHAVQVVMDQDLAGVIAELDEMERAGLTAINPIARSTVSARRLLTLTDRAHALMGTAMTTMLANELKALGSDDFEFGQRIDVTVDATANTGFRSKTHRALALASLKNQNSTGILCMPLVVGQPLRVNPMCNATGRAAQSASPNAEVVSLSAATNSGDLDAMYLTSDQLLTSQVTLGSISKLVLEAAAARLGISPETRFCAQQAKDGARVLRRARAPRTGHTSAECGSGKGMLTVREIIGESDNLGAYSLAKAIGDAELAAWVVLFGMQRATTGSLAYEVSFGTLTANPIEMLAIYRALVHAAYRGPNDNVPPKMNLVAISQQPDQLIYRVSRAISTPEQKATLRALLEAPIATNRGTARYLKGLAGGAKTGSVQSESRDVMGNRNAHARWLVSHDLDAKRVNLFLVSAPAQAGLGLHDLQNSMFLQAQRLPLTTVDERLRPAPAQSRRTDHPPNHDPPSYGNEDSHLANNRFKQYNPQPRP